MRGFFKGKINKVIISIITLVFVASNFYFLIFYSATEAKAQYVTIDPTQAAIQIPWKGLEIARYSMEEILNDLKATFFKNVVANLSRQFAKSYSQFMVTGAKGGKPFWETNVWDSIKNQGDAAFEDWLTAAISNGTGLDLCKLDPTLTLNIALTLPNKRDKSGKVKKEKTVLGSEAAEGCSFEDLKDKFSTDSKGWQDFVKIKATDIGPDFRETIDQLSRDISLNQNLRQNNAGVNDFTNPPPVLSDLTTKTNDLGAMRNELDSDVTIMIDKRGTKDQVTLSVGSYILAPEYITEIKAAWVKKIGAGRSEANTKKSAFRSCYNKNIVSIRLDPCASLLKELGYTVPPGENWVQANPDKAQQFVREVQSKLETTYNLYNSLANGYEGLYSFINSQIKPEMFESGGLYTYQKAKTQFQPQADPASSTQQQVEAGTTKAQTTAEERKRTEVSTTGGWKNSVETISGYIKTPADLLKAKSIESLAKGDSVGTFTKSIVADSLGIFLQELYNMYINQLLMALSNPKKQKSTKDGNTFNAEKQSVVTEEGVNLYYDTLDPSFISNLPDVDLLQEFQTTINAKKINPNIYNNVIDLNFAMAINQRMTIGEAMSGFSPKLNGGLGFSWSESLTPNTLNLSNIRKLRKARVVPLGLELAAELIRDCNYRNILDEDGDGVANFAEYQDLILPNGYFNSNKPYDTQRMQNCLFKTADSPELDALNSLPAGIAKDTAINEYLAPFKTANINLMNKVVTATLADVVEGFDDRGSNGICGDFDNATESPFCNLVDPNWVLKIPATKCLQNEKIDTYGEVLRDNESGSRYMRCADFISCLMDDSKNNCATPLADVPQYGVCIKEKNVWRMGGETCQPQYDSCRAYTMTDSRGKDSDVAFLKNTLDPSGCSPETVGCKGYTRSYDNKKIYFNRNVETCEDKAEGCHEFITDQTTLNNLIADSTLPTSYDENILATRVYYKINPACDTNPEGTDCTGFMTKCFASEVGCAEYKPASGNPAVTAVLNEEDQCPAECDGFSAFFRQPTSFEPNSQLAYFVNKNTTTCSAADVGCAEFTNLEKINTGVPVAEALEYYTSLRQCIKPGATGKTSKTYFTWQSIATGPQQVIKHVLQSITTASDVAAYPANIGVIGAPATYDYSGDCRSDLSATNYCLKFYDATGNTFYRDIRKTIIVSETGCYPLRKTSSNEVTCTATNGNWDNTNNYCTFNAYVPTAQEAAKAGFGEKSQTCSAADNGCFNYLGASGNNVYSAFFDTFEESVFPEEWQADDNLSIVPEALSETGNSLQINAGAQAIRSAEINGGKYYVLDFLAKGDCSGGATSVAGSLAVTGFGSVNLDCGWGSYQLGPLIVDSNLNNANLVITNQTNVPISIDNVGLVQYKANYYLIENSWQQVGCSVEDLNCEAYDGPNNQTFYIKQFSNLCGADKVGCQYLIDTKNSINPQAQDFSGVIVPADNLTSYVVKKDFKCTIEAKGCEKFIEPVISADSGIGYNNVILKNDPEVYTGLRSILCPADAEGCTELTNEAGYPEYYKIDATKICQYTHNLISGVGQDIYGWYMALASEVTGCNTVSYDNAAGCEANAGTWNSLNQTCSNILTPAYVKSVACTANLGIWLTDYAQCVKEIPSANYHNEAGCIAQSGVWTAGTGTGTGTCTLTGTTYSDSLACGANKGIWSSNKCLVYPFSIYKVSDAGYDNFTGTCPLKAGNCTGFQTIDQENKLSDQVYYLIDNENNINRQGCASYGTDWNKGCVAFKNTVNNEVQTIKVTKDRDCAEWVDCVKKDNVGNCIKMANNTYKTISGNPRVEATKVSVSTNYCSMLNPAECGFESDFCILTGTGLTLRCVTTNTFFKVYSGYDKVRYDNTGASEIITRKTYVQRFSSVQEIWDAGDYSGYTIPNRYPLELELASAYNFKTYPREKTAGLDSRFSEPVCKIFAAEDAPLPVEILRKTGYSKIRNVYSLSVNVEDVGSGCNYDMAEAQGVTTYFPFAYLSNIFGDTDPKICTGLTSVNGKLCEGHEKKNPDCKTSSNDEDDKDSTVASNAYGTCKGIENIKANFGIQGRCLEMDILNPLYGNVKTESYACLSYYPFQYDECLAIGTDDVKCKKMPNCTWIDATATVPGQCTGDICRFLKSQETCEADKTKCLWDGAKQKCLFKICSLSGVTTKADCNNMADYCGFYGNRCIEDICASTYANLNGYLNSHDESKTDLCINTAAGIDPLNKDPDNTGVPGNGAYCSWQMKGPVNKGRYYFSCNLKCEDKYPTDTAATYKQACIADQHCRWGTPKCQGKCDGLTAFVCESTSNCSWSEVTGNCVDGCVAMDKNQSWPDCQVDGRCNFTATCVDNGNVCSGLTDLTDPPCSGPKGKIPPSTTDTSICTWTPPVGATPGNCHKKPEFECASKSATTCTAIPGCKLASQTCTPKITCAGKDQTTCTTTDSDYCAWGGGKCEEEFNIRGCQAHDLSNANASGNSNGELCRAAPNCRWSYRDYGRGFNFCFPADCTKFTQANCVLNSDCNWNGTKCVSGLIPQQNYNTEYTCHMCPAPLNGNTCSGSMCN